MTSEEPNQGPSCPPTVPGQIEPAMLGQRQSGWPSVLGVIAIVLGTLGVLGAVVGFVSQVLMSEAMSRAPQGQWPNTMSMEKWKPWLVTSALLTTGVAIVLVLGGTSLVGRRRRAVALCVTWALLKIPLGAANAFVGYVMQQSQFEAMKRSSPISGGMPVGTMTGFAVLSVFGGLLWAWALPVFMLVWFSRSKIRAEISQWI